MASIQKMKNGYRVRAAGVWRERPDGTRYRDRKIIASGIPTLREAKAIAAKETSPDYIPPHALTCKDQRLSYVQSKRDAGRSESQVRNLSLDLAKWWAPIDHIPLMGLQSDHLDDLKRRLESATGRDGRSPLSHNQRMKVWQATVACLNQAVEQRKIAWNPANGCTPPAPPPFDPDADDERPSWNEETWARFVRFVDVDSITDETDYMLAVAVLLDYELALRAGELAALKWSDRDGGVVRIRRSRSMVGGKADIPVKQTKTGAGRRRVSVSPVADRLWRSLHSRQVVASLDGCLFTIDGEPVHPARIIDRFEALRDAFLASNPDVARITFYGLRHSGISAWVRRGTRPELVKMMAGHKNFAFTIDRYYDATDEEIAAALSG